MVASQRIFIHDMCEIISGFAELCEAARDRAVRKVLWSWVVQKVQMMQGLFERSGFAELCEAERFENFCEVGWFGKCKWCKDFSNGPVSRSCTKPGGSKSFVKLDDSESANDARTFRTVRFHGALGWFFFFVHDETIFHRVRRDFVCLGDVLTII